MTISSTAHRTGNFSGPATRNQAMGGHIRQVFMALAATAFYSLLLWYAYKVYVSPRFAYEGLTYRPPHIVGFTVANVVTALVSCFLPSRIRCASDFIVWTFWVIAGAPTILLAQFMQTLPVHQATILGLIVAGCMLFAAVLSGAIKTFPDRLRPKVDENSVFLGLVIVAFAVYAGLIAVAGVHIRWLALLDVYDVRSEYSRRLASLPLIGYLLPIVANVINPIFVARGIARRSRFWLAAGGGGQFIIYTTTGQKSVLFSLLALGAVAWLFRKDPAPWGTRLLTGTFYVIAAAVALDWLQNSFLWNALLIRRFLVVPGSLTVDYVSVFSSRPHGEFRGTPLFWLEPVYSRGPSYIVGQGLTGNANNNANVSFLGHGFFNLGYIGMFIETFVFVLFIWALAAACQGLPTRIAALAVLMTTFAVASTNIFTVLTSHGGLALVLICAILPRTGWESPQARHNSELEDDSGGANARPSKLKARAR